MVPVAVSTSRTAVVLAMATVFLAAFHGGSSATAPPLPDCFSSLLNMSDCLTFVERGSNLTAPGKGCCPELAGLVDSNPICLCKLLAMGGAKLDLSKAMKLPEVCKVKTPSVSSCSAAGIPVGAPTAAADSIAPGASSSEGSDNNPADNKKGNGAAKLARSSAFVICFAISFISSF